MSGALQMPPRMTVAEFLEWEPDDRSGARWQLRDGEPEMMAPTSDPHGSIQSELAYLSRRISGLPDDRAALSLRPALFPRSAPRTTA